LKKFKSEARASAGTLPGSKLDILFILPMLLTMQCKCTFTKRFALFYTVATTAVATIAFRCRSNVSFSFMLLFTLHSTKLRSLPRLAVTVSQHFLWGAVRKNIISDRFSTKTAISAYLAISREFRAFSYLCAEIAISARI